MGRLGGSWWLRAVAVGASVVACTSLDGLTSPAGSNTTLDGSADGVEPSGVDGVVCAPSAPAGWQGPLGIMEVRGTPLPALNACPAPFGLVFEGRAEPDAPQGACTCACAPPATGTCAAPTGTFYADANCTTPCSAAKPVPKAGASCDAFDASSCPTQRFLKLSDAVVEDQRCTPSTAGAPSPVTWRSAVRLCRGGEGNVTCRPGKSPTLVTALPFEPGNYCMATRGDAACPESYPVERSFYEPEAASDTRGCNPCACAPPSATCGGTVVTADTGVNCSGGLQLSNVPSTCASVKASNSSWGYTPSGAAKDIKCAPIGGGPLAGGAFTPSGRMRVCCSR